MLYYIISFLVTIVMVFFFKKIAIKLNIVDKPNNRKVHKTPKPLLGGLAIYCSITLVYSLSLNFQVPFKTLEIFGLALVLVLVGLYDDIKDMKAVTKLFWQLVIAFLTSCVIGGINKIEVYHLIFNFTEFQGIILETIWIVALVNAFNLIDGLDGLSSGIGIISLFSLYLMALINNDITSTVLVLIIISSLLGFLYYNFYPSTIFLGDSGAMLIGFMISLVSLTKYKTITLTSLMLLILISFMPFLDVFLAIVRRKKQKQRAFKADSLHFHHRLLRKGFSHEHAVLILYVIMAFYGAVAVSLEALNNVLLKWYLLAFLGVLTLFIFEKLYLLSDNFAYITKSIKWIKRTFCKIIGKESK